MKILLSNKFYYYKGGDSIHAIELEKLLRLKGHEVAFFAMQHPQNLPSDYSSYFPSEVDYTRKNAHNIREQVMRPMYSREVKRKFHALLDHFKPDILHVHNIHSQLSPVIVEEASRKGIPVFWTLHDYKLLCPRYDCQRDDKPCELCFSDKRNVIRYRCVKEGLLASILAYGEAMVWNREKLSGITTTFICPSDFIRQKMIAGGFEEEKLATLNNFIPDDQFDPPPREDSNYYCYVGRLSREKGVETLLKAASRLPEFQLKIIGTGPLHDYFTKQYGIPHIEFCGHHSKDDVKKLLSQAMFSVMPSECYENNPLAVIESLCVGTPVIGADTGGIPELISENSNGSLFESGNQADLEDRIKKLMGKGRGHFNTGEIAAHARDRFSPTTYYDKLLSIYASKN